MPVRLDQDRGPRWCRGRIPPRRRGTAVRTRTERVHSTAPSRLPSQHQRTQRFGVPPRRNADIPRSRRPLERPTLYERRVNPRPAVFASSQEFFKDGCPDSSHRLRYLADRPAKRREREESIDGRALRAQCLHPKASGLHGSRRRSRNFTGRVDRPRHGGTDGGNNRRRRGLVDRFGAVARGAAFAMVSMAVEQLSYLPAPLSRILDLTKLA